MNPLIKVIFLIPVGFFAACTKGEKVYTETEARRWADSAARVEIEKWMIEAEKNFEYRKKVELPYRFGPEAGSPGMPPSDPDLKDSPDHETRTESPREERQPGPQFKRMTER